MQTERFAEFLGVFVDVAREGSFSGAARYRGVQPSSVSRQIDLLEGHLKTALFLRSTRVLTLTDAGEALLIRARRILDDLADAQQEMASLTGDVAGVLRIACFPTFGKRYVIPVISALAARHPRLRVELDLTERLADPVAERFDLVIRIGDLADSTLIATRLATHTRVLCASARYLAQSGSPRSATDLLEHCLVDKMHGADLLGWADVLGRRVRRCSSKAVFACDDFEAMRLAVLADMGVGYLPDWVVGPDIQGGRLMHVLPALSLAPRAQMGIFALRALSKPSATVRLVLDELKAFIGEPASWSVANSGK